MKQEKPFIITLIILLIVTFLIFMYKKGIPTIKKIQAEIEVLYNAVFEEDFDAINLETIDSNIVIKDNESEDIRIEIHGVNRDVIYSSITDNELTVRYVNEDYLEDKGEEIVVYLPDTYTKKISLLTQSGDIVIDDYKKASIAIEDQSSNIEIGKVKNLEISTGSGEVKVDSVLNKVTLKSNDANVKINSLQLKQTSTIETTSGNVEILQNKDMYINATSTEGKVTNKSNIKKTKQTLTITSKTGNISVN